jgi:hypothetical protein
MLPVFGVLGGATALAGLFAFVDLRTGRFGSTVIQIHRDDEFATIQWTPFYHVAYWIPGDVRTMVYQRSWKPIVFEYTDEYLGFHPEIDQPGNKS